MHKESIARQQNKWITQNAKLKIVYSRHNTTAVPTIPSFSAAHPYNLCSPSCPSACCCSASGLFVNQTNGDLQYSLISMNAIITSFNKAEVNQCTDRCITTLQHKSFTPDELNCFQRCTRNLSKLQPIIGRLRSDSEELALRMGAL